MKKRKGRIAQLLVMSVITLAMALSIYRNPEHESLVVLLLLWCYFGWNLWTTQQLCKKPFGGGGGTGTQYGADPLCDRAFFS